MEQIKQKVGAVVPPVKVSGNPLEDLKLAQSSPDVADVIKQFYERQMARMDVEDQVLAEKREKERLNHLLMIEENARLARSKEAGQEQCTHQNVMGTATAIRGNRNGARMVIAICQRCQKVWNQQESGGYMDSRGRWLAPHLQPDPDIHVGGIV